MKKVITLNQDLTKRIVILVVIAVVCIAGAWLVLSRKPLPNVLLITVDTTRADRIGCYGYEAAKTPALDSLAREGIRFTAAYAHTPLTLPSHATIMTGLLPPENGLRYNAQGSLDPRIPTVAKVLQAHGYRTGAFLASFVLDKQFGLSSGFDHYDDNMVSSKVDSEVFHAENPANVISSRVIKWLKDSESQNKLKKKPFFAWVHFYDPHDKYSPPESYRKQFEDPYDGEISFMDGHIGRILDHLTRMGVSENTLIIIVGDHGEAFGEHDEYQHGYLLYNTTMHVPLIVRMPRGIKPVVIDRLTAIKNIPATIMDVTGIKEHLFPGISLVGEQADDSSIYGETLMGYYVYKWSPISRLTTERWTYIDAPEAELYDRIKDPAELNNLAVTENGVAQDLKKQLDGLRAGLKSKAVAGTIALSKQAELTLRSLGYAGGSSANSDELSESIAVSLPDPKRMIKDVHNVRQQAQVLIDKRRTQEAIPLIESIVGKCPESIELREMLVSAYLRIKQPQKAIPHMEYVVGADPSRRPMWVNLADQMMQAQKYAKAIEMYRKVLSLPDGPLEKIAPSGVSTVTLNARGNLGVCFIITDRLDEAAKQFMKILEIEPDNMGAISNLAAVREKQNSLKVR